MLYQNRFINRRENSVLAAVHCVFMFCQGPENGSLVLTIGFSLFWFLIVLVQWGVCFEG